MSNLNDPIVDIRHVVYWDEVTTPTGDKTLQPVRQEFRFLRIGHTEYEKIQTDNMVPSHLSQPPEAKTEE